MDNENVRAVINATGALAEMLSLFRKNLKENGFSDSECMYLCGSMLKALIFNGKATDNGQN